MKPAATINSAQRVLRVFKALKGHTLTGLSNQELAQATGESAANVSRAVATLMAESLVAKLDNGRYAHSIATLQMAQAHAEHCGRVTTRMAEINQRIAAGAH